MLEREIKLSDSESHLHQRALMLAEKYRRCEIDLLVVLQEIDEKRVYIKLGYTCLYDYAVQDLKLSESSAFNFIAVARKAREIPQIQEAIASGTLSVSKVRKMTVVLTKENADEWMNRAKSLTHKELERQVADERWNAGAPPFHARSVSLDRVSLQMGISEELMQKLLRVQDILSQKKRSAVQMQETLATMTEDFLERHDPVRKAQRALERKARSEEAETEKLAVVRHVVEENVEVASNDDDFYTQMERNHGREVLQSIVKHQVMARDDGQCTFVHPNGQRCRQRRFIEIHHIKAVSEGGKDRLENLRLLCSAHHRRAHIGWYRGQAMAAKQQQQSIWR